MVLLRIIMSKSASPVAMSSPTTLPAPRSSCSAADRENRKRHSRSRRYWPPGNSASRKRARSRKRAKASHDIAKCHVRPVTLMGQALPGNVDGWPTKLVHYFRTAAESANGGRTWREMMESWAS